MGGVHTGENGMCYVTVTVCGLRDAQQESTSGRQRATGSSKLNSVSCGYRLRTITFNY